MDLYTPTFVIPRLEYMRTVYFWSSVPQPSTPYVIIRQELATDPAARLEFQVSADALIVGGAIRGSIAVTGVNRRVNVTFGQATVTIGSMFTLAADAGSVGSQLLLCGNLEVNGIFTVSGTQGTTLLTPDFVRRMSMRDDTSLRGSTHSHRI